jgi:glucokinase
VDGLSHDALLELIAETVEELRTDDVAAVGIGIPALIDSATEEVLFSVHHDLAGRQVSLDLPTAIDNDSNCAMLAEWRAGAAHGSSNAVSISLGTGVGGGLVLGGRMFRGAHGIGAELGHIVVDADGPECFGACPGRGCLEAVASGSALGREGSRLLGRPVAGEDVTALALAGDRDALAAVATIARGLGAGLASVVHAFDPEVVVVGGGVMALGETLLRPAREEMRQRLQPPYLDRVRVVPAAFREDAAMLGAAILAMELVS